MCYAIPGRIVTIKGRVATIDYFGERRTASLIGNGEAKVGKYVYAQGGIVLDSISEPDALVILGTWKERFFELKRLDQEATMAGRGGGKLANILEKAESKKPLTRKEMEAVLKTQEVESGAIYSAANRIRSRELGNSCCVHGILEFSNHCQNGCAYCGINKNNKNVKRYRMTIDEIVERAGYAIEELGFKALVLQSGEDPYYTEDMLVRLVKRIRERYGVLLFLSIGERPFECYRRLYKAGAYGALIRFETSNMEIFSRMRPGKRLDERIGLIKKLIAYGFIVATGFIIGLPGATEQDLINDILLTKSLKPDMYSFGPLIPHPQTPIANTDTVPLSLALKTISLSRLADPKAKILATTALETLGLDGKRMGLLAGANSLMINVTPEKYRINYEIYPNKAGNEKPIKNSIQETLDLLYSLGRAPTDLGR